MGSAGELVEDSLSVFVILLLKLWYGYCTEC